MSLTVAGLVAEGETVIDDTACVATSFPSFVATLNALAGGDAVTVEAVEPLALKGKREPVPAFRLVSVDATAEAFTRHLDNQFARPDLRMLHRLG